MNRIRIITHALFIATVICGLSDRIAAQPDSVSTDTLISRVYIQFLDAADLNLPDEFDIYILRPDTTYAIAERVIDSAGVHMLWTFHLVPPRSMAECGYRPHIRGFEPELLGTPEIELEGTEWTAKCTYRLNRIWQVEVESDPGGVGVMNLNLQVSQSTDFITPPMPWEEELTLELFCVPGYRFSYSINIDADSLFNLPNGLVHNKKFIKNLILENTTHMNLFTRIKMSELVRVNKIVFRPKLP